VFSLQCIPNPASTQTLLTAELPVPAQVTICVVNVLGASVLRQVTGFYPAGKQSFVLDLAGLERGMYAVILNTENQRIATKLLIR
jgi:hypothetical protein